MTIPAITGGVLPAGAPGKSPEEKAALGFERQLLMHLTEQLARTAQPEDEATSAASNAYRDMLPGALADAMVAAGGIGLAAQMVKETGR